MDADPTLHMGDFRQEADYWSFEGRAERRFAHGFLQYPAMMVPQMQGELIDLLRATAPQIHHVWDPFVGAGTTLSEAMLRGLDFTGNDINPLAVLVSKTKRGPLHVHSAIKKTAELYARIAADTAINVNVNFPGLNKWFSSESATTLSRIRRAIKQEPALWARRFFWVAMAECVRLTSNSRTSTYKLHLRPSFQLEKPREDTLNVFKRILDKNLKHLSEFKRHLDQNGFLKNGYYVGKTGVSLADTSKLEGSFLKQADVDLVITSPPYGDNRTTVPYGQYSYLPLNWIDLKDIEKNIDISLMRTTNSIDSASLGGAIKNHAQKLQELSSLYPSFQKLMQNLEAKPEYATKKVTSFFYDFDQCIDPIVSRLRDGGFMIWTLGNRTVAKTQIPLDLIFQEMIEHRGLDVIKKLERTIPSKRTPSKNSVSETMASETIVIARKTIF
jgi:DNA modification methylase